MLIALALPLAIAGEVGRAKAQGAQSTKRVDIDGHMSIAIPSGATLSKDPKAYPDHTFYFVHQADEKILTVIFSMLPPRAVDRGSPLRIGNCPAMVMPAMKSIRGGKDILVEYQQAPWGRRNVRFSYQDLTPEKAAVAERIVASLHFADATACSGTTAR